MTKRIMNLLLLIGTIFTILFFIYAFKHHVFQDPKVFRQFIKSFGPFGVVVFILLQTIQPIIPIIPGGLSDVFGIIMFGNILGLFYVCFGLVIGESIVFLLIRKYGRPFIQKILSDNNQKKLDKLILKSNKHIQRLIIIVFLMPFGPDDLICYAAGLSNLSFRRYFWTIAILKPISVGVHCFIMIHFFKII
ncbi:TVP38/TMEM64 family protein [Vagococcus vulneris]|uniref:TVP38/TMEM64 family membrane protein n=1 Tax=Vagococcus vulneris TaxID=1977869 RepID=A0A429ZZA2_9ENTE|nr:VTT domain-containing protein [Vagococcus vulneris]RST99331.1 hypothetical protein CBF37_05010 [Vagococcus vulneris]